MNIQSVIARELQITEQQVQSALDLFSQDATIPFIARYRKEQTGHLDEDQLNAIEKSWKTLNALEERKDAVRRILEEKKQLTESLAASIEACTSLAALEEIYRPYKEKKKTKASAAIEAGYGKLAEKLKMQKGTPDRIPPVDLEQAGYILAEEIAQDPGWRQLVRHELLAKESLQAARRKEAEDPQGIFESYYEFSAPLSKIRPHQVLALERGEKEKVLSLAISADPDRLTALLSRKIVRNPSFRSWYETVIRDALSRLMLPSLKREIRSVLREKAHTQAIANFADNLEHLLMARPVKGCRVLAWDPGYVNGCKLALLDENGMLLDTEIVYPFRHSGKNRTQEVSEKNLAQVQGLLKRWKPELVVIGNGTASRESQALIASAIQDFPQIRYVIGSEAGASVYSASPAAKEEFPDLPVEKRSAVSIGRRVQDPLSELVKIDPQSLGIGEYQHDVPAKQLKEALDFVTEKAVNRVGVNVNTASAALLRSISGLTKPSITKIIKTRSIKPIAARSELSKILSAKTYEQAIGFLRIPDSSHPLDRTGIHPESYALTEKLLALLNLEARQMGTTDFNRVLERQNAAELAQKLHADSYTISDILTELAHPGLDPRDSLDGPVLLSGILQLEDLHPGMKLEGTVRNVTSFGAFVDIGLHEDGLVHISRMSSGYVSAPSDIVHTGQIVTVYVVETDARRRRISLSLLPVSA